MNETPSLYRRIIFRLAMTTLVAIVVAYGWLWWKFGSTWSALHNRALVSWTDQIAKGLSVTEDGNVHLTLPKEMMDAYARTDLLHRFAVSEREGDRLFAEGGDTAPLPEKLPFTGAYEFYLHDPDGPGPLSFVGVIHTLDLGEKGLVIQVEHGTSEYRVLTEAIVEEFFADGGWLAAPFLLAFLAVSIITIRSSLAPLVALSRQAEAIGPNTTDIRLPEDGVPSEILPLVHAVNSAFDRLENGYRVEKEFTADAAHELRTPLAVLAANIDTVADRDTAIALRKDLDGMIRLVSQLLKVAQVEAMVLATDQRADLNEIATEAGAWMGPLAVKSGRSIEVMTANPPPIVRGNAEALFHAVRNLMENALTYTPRGTLVTVRVGANPPCIIIRDRGPGVPLELRERIFQRFWRAERTSSGAGLGLAIVKRTMEAHGGEVSIRDARGGGAEFVLEFPEPEQTQAGWTEHPSRAHETAEAQGPADTLRRFLPSFLWSRARSHNDDEQAHTGLET